jgi:hypothetical protein
MTQEKNESYSVNLHDGFPGKSMKNVPNIRQFSRTYTKKTNLSHFTLIGYTHCPTRKIQLKKYLSSRKNPIMKKFTNIHEWEKINLFLVNVPYRKSSYNFTWSVGPRTRDQHQWFEAS